MLFFFFFWKSTYIIHHHIHIPFWSSWKEKFFFCRSKSNGLYVTIYTNTFINCVSIQSRCMYAYGTYKELCVYVLLKENLLHYRKRASESFSLSYRYKILWCTKMDASKSSISSSLHLLKNNLYYYYRDMYREGRTFASCYICCGVQIKNYIEP